MAGRLKLLRLAVPTIIKGGSCVDKQFRHLGNGAVAGACAEKGLLHYHRQMGMRMDVDICVYNSGHVSQTDSLGAFLPAATASVGSIDGIKLPDIFIVVPIVTIPSAEAEKHQNPLGAVSVLYAQFPAHKPGRIDAVIFINAVFMVSGSYAYDLISYRPHQVNPVLDLLHGGHKLAVHVAHAIPNGCVHQIAIENDKAVRVVLCLPDALHNFRIEAVRVTNMEVSKGVYVGV